MSLHLRWKREQGGITAMVILIVSAYAVTLLQGEFTPAHLIQLLVLGIIYLTLNILSALFLDYHPRMMPMAVAYFGGMLLLATAINFVAMRGQSFAMTWLITLPLVSQSQDVHPRPMLWNWTVSLLSIATFLIPLAYAFGTVAALQNILFVIPAILFVNVFTRVAQREREARERVEQLAQALNEANQQLRLYAAQAEELATTKERNRLAREIHDSLGHYLTVINVQIEAAQAILDQDRPKGMAALQKAQRLTQEGLQEVRHSVKALRESPLDGRKLHEAVQDLVEACRTAGLVAELAVTGEPDVLPQEMQMALYRAAQEGLTNVRKHARASRVDVTLEYAPDGVGLQIVDNGIGAAATHSGFGLIGIQERVALLGGRVQAETRPTQGFRLAVQIPYQKAEVSSQ
jgi:signal transduction histidine kinase